MRAWLEFHDSLLVWIRQLDAVTELALLGYVHRWERIDGEWHGTGWVQSVRIAVHGTVAQPAQPVPRHEIGMGILRLGSTTHTNLVALPLASREPVEVRLELTGGAVVEIRGRGIEVEPKDEGQLVEDLPLDLLPSQLK